MILSIVAALLVLAITFYHSLFGLFSGLINVFCTIIGLAVAFGFYAPLNAFAASQGLHPAYTEPACLVGLFVLTVGVLRTVADLGIRGNVRLPMYVDWVGGAICGFINAEISVGVLLVGTLMLPWGDSLMGFKRYTRVEDSTLKYAEFERNSIFLAPDEFTVGLFNMLSGGSLSSSTAFKTVYPDFVQWVAWTGNTVQLESTPAPYRDDEGDGAENGLRVVSWWNATDTGVTARYLPELPGPRTEISNYTDPEPVQLEDPQANKLIGVRLELDKSSADRAGNAPRHLFRPTMIRLVGKLGETRWVQIPPRVLGGTDALLRGENRRVDWDNNFSLDVTDGAVVVDAYFEVPRDMQPQFVEYRRHARDEVSAAALAEAAPEPLSALLTVEERESIERVGRQGFIGAVNSRASGMRTRLPFDVSLPKVAAQVQNAGSDILVGRFSGSRETLTGGGAVLNGVGAPEGMGVLNVTFKPYVAKSLVGQVFNFVGRTANTYSAVAASGEKFRLSGYYVTIKRNGETYMELFYAGGAPDSPEAIAYRGGIDLKDIDPRSLTDPAMEAEVSLLFVVPKGKEIERIENQNGEGVKGLDFRT